MWQLLGQAAPEVHKLMDECIDKNMVDKDEYPQTAEIESRCVWTAVKFPKRDLVMKLTPKVPIPSSQDEFDQTYIRIPESD